jgi:hypothetical protein
MATSVPPQVKTRLNRTHWLLWLLAVAPAGALFLEGRSCLEWHQEAQALEGQGQVMERLHGLSDMANALRTLSAGDAAKATKDLKRAFCGGVIHLDSEAQRASAETRVLVREWLNRMSSALPEPVKDSLDLAPTPSPNQEGAARQIPAPAAGASSQAQ